MSVTLPTVVTKDTDNICDYLCSSLSPCFYFLKLVMGGGHYLPEGGHTILWSLDRVYKIPPPSNRGHKIMNAQTASKHTILFQKFQNFPGRTPDPLF